MKHSVFFSFLVLVAGMFLNVSDTLAQKNPSTEISYTVPFGPVFPIDGRSNQLDGQIEINDSTGVLEELRFEVSLNSFIGMNGGYLAWVGNSLRYPHMSFRSHNVKQKGDSWIVNGTVEFRNQIAPMTIFLERADTKKEIVLKGNFTFRPREHFITPPSFELVPGNIPMEFTMVFDKPEGRPEKVIG